MATPFVASARDSSCGVVTITAPVKVMHCDKVICTSPVPSSTEDRIERERESERARESESEREREKDREKESER